MNEVPTAAEWEQFTQEAWAVIQAGQADQWHATDCTALWAGMTHSDHYFGVLVGPTGVPSVHWFPNGDDQCEWVLSYS